MKILADNKIPYLKGVLEPLADVVYLPGSAITKDDAKDADALIIRTRTKCNKELLDGSKVRFIATATIGHDHIDKSFCESRHITWANAPGCNSWSVGQYMTSALLHLACRNEFELREKTLGIVGVGNSGSKVEKMARILGLNVLLNDPPRERLEGSTGFVDIETIQRKSDIIAFHVPLIKEGPDKTHKLVDREFIKKLKKTSFLMNTSRGSVIDNQDLKEAILTKKLAGAVLDVWENEPDIDPDLHAICQIATPHIAGYAADGKALGTTMSIRSISNFFDLGLNNWSPHSIFFPERHLLTIDCRNKSEQEVIFEIVHHTYAIFMDDERLRDSPQTFEKQRGDYPLRREFSAYSIRLKHGSGTMEDTLKRMGFEIVK